MSLWDRLPPELQLMIFNQAIRLRAAENPLKLCHSQIRQYYFDPNKSTTTWPLPHRNRALEYNVPISIVNGRYFRPIYNGMLEKPRYANAYRDGPRYFLVNPETIDESGIVDITQAELPPCYHVRKN
jgi:hypothetical protein